MTRATLPLLLTEFRKFDYFIRMRIRVRLFLKITDIFTLGEIVFFFFENEAART